MEECMKQVLFVLLVITVVFAQIAVGLDIGGDALLWLVGMQQANLLVADYNQTNEEDMPELSLALGGEVEMGLLPVMGFDTLAGVRALSCSTSAEREKASTSLFGGYIGASFDVGSLSAGVDIGAYRGTFSFLAQGYEDLSGWGFGITGRTAYSLAIGPALELKIGISLQWLPIEKLHDSSGGVYALRDGPFLNYSGIGGLLGITWCWQ
jgi:hypothetical protein